MHNTLSEKIRIATQDLILTDSQRNIVAGRLTRALMKVDVESVSVEEVRQLIQQALVGVPGDVVYVREEEQKPEKQATVEVVAEGERAEAPEVIEVDEDAYRVNHVVKRTSSG